MKNTIIFLLFLILGFTISVSYFYFKTASNNMYVSLVKSYFSLLNAPSKSLQGNIIFLTGDVAWQSRIASAPIKITSPQTIQQGESIVTGNNGNVELGFTGATITIFPMSQINVIQTLPVNLVFDQENGKATYTKLSTNPVSIHTLDLITVVNKGDVTIEANKDKNSINVVIDSGSATESYDDLSENSKVITLTQGQKFIFDNSSKEAIF